MREIEHLDVGIAPAVRILLNHGFKTFESCEGGEGHAFHDPIIRFFGSEFDLIRAFEICEAHKLNIYEARRVFRKGDIYDHNRTKKAMPIGIAWENPFNEIIFLIHPRTGTIFLPH